MESSPRRRSVRREMLEFAIPSILLLITLSAVAVWLTFTVARTEVINNAVAKTQFIATTAIEPLLTESLRDGDGQAVDAVDAIARTHILGDDVVMVRIWDEDGQVLYSENRDLIGQRFPLSEDSLRVLREGGAEAEVSDLSRTENQQDTVTGELVEVYLQASGPDGEPLLFETYQSADSLSAAVSRMAVPLIPLIAGSLLILTVVLVGLGYRMARRVNRERERREDLLRKALDASDLERRRIAADLHDGVVQDLVGVSYSVAAVAARTAGEGQTETADALRASSERVRQAVTGLRSLLVDIYPPNLARAGLSAALTDLVERLPGDMGAQARIGDDLELSEDEQQNLYRVAREALINVVKHSRATVVELSLTRQGRHVTLSIVDNGVGFDPAAIAAGHVGLSLLADLAAGADATLSVESAPGRGVALTYEFEAGSRAGV